MSRRVPEKAVRRPGPEEPWEGQRWLSPGSLVPTQESLRFPLKGHSDWLSRLNRLHRPGAAVVQCFPLAAAWETGQAVATRREDGVQGYLQVALTWTRRAVDS